MGRIIIIAPPRSGSTVTAKLIQSHLGDFPFEVNEYGEPKELVDILNKWNDRNGRNWMIFHQYPPIDDELREELDAWFKVQEEGVIKSPMFSIVHRVIPVEGELIYLDRNREAIAKSLKKHRKEMISLEFARDTVDWMKKLIDAEKFDIDFSSPDYKEQVKAVIDKLGLKWDEDKFQKIFNPKKIHNDRSSSATKETE